MSIVRGNLRPFLLCSIVLLISIAALGFTFWQLGYLAPDQIGWFASVGAFHAVGLPYVAGMAFLSMDRAPRDLDALASIFRGTSEDLASLQRSLGRPPHLALLMALASTLAVPWWLVRFEDSIWAKAVAGGPEALPWISLCPFSLFHWTVGVFAAGVLFHSTWIFHSLGKRSVDVDVFCPEETEPFARVGSRNGLFVLGMFAIFPLMWVARPIATPDLSAFPFAFALAVVGTILPMRGVRVATRDAKRTKLADLDSQIRQTRDAKPETPQFANLADLLTVKEAVLAAREWPLSSQMLERLFLYFLLPLFSWVCGALVEQYVDRLLESVGAGG